MTVRSGFPANRLAQVSDLLPIEDATGALEEHVRRHFAGRVLGVHSWEAGPLARHNRHFRVLCVRPPMLGGVWTYVSVGGWGDETRSARR